MKGTKQVRQNYPSKCFAWSFKPIFYLLIVTAGLRLDTASSSSKSFCVKVIISALGLLIFLSNFLANGCQATYNLQHSTESLLQELLNQTWYINTDTVAVKSRLLIAQGVNYYYRYLLLILGVPLIFNVHLVLTGKWKKLWSILQMIHLEMKLSKEFYWKCRKQCWLGFCFLVLVAAPILLEYVYHWNRDRTRYWSHFAENGTLYHITYALHNWSRGIEMAIQSVFFVMVTTAALLFEELGKRLPNSFQTSRGLARWKRHYDFVCCFVEEINSTFGLILLIQIGYITIEMITDSYFFMTAFKGFIVNVDGEISTGFLVVSFIHVFIRLLIITVSSWHMQNQQNGLTGVILNLPSSYDTQQQLEKNTILLHLTSFPISISAANVLKIDLILVVTVISASLNYGSVLFQDRLTAELGLAVIARDQMLEVLEMLLDFIV